MKIQILGMGCPKCRKLFELTKKVLRDLELEEVQLEKVEDLAEIAEMGAMITPALAVDGDIKLAGRVPSSGELVELLLGLV